jgi:hypothetical protein
MGKRKPRFNGDGAGTLVPDFAASVRTELRRHLAPWFDQHDMGAMRAFLSGGGDSAWRSGDGSDELVAWLVHDAYALKVDIANRKALALTKPELVAEFARLIKSMQAAHDHLRSVSRDLDRMLALNPATRVSVEAGLADLLKQSADRKAAVEASATYQRTRVFEHAVKLRLVELVSERLLSNGIPVSGRDTPLFDVLDCLGRALELKLTEEKTWRNAVSALKAVGSPAPSTRARSEARRPPLMVTAKTI